MRDGKYLSLSQVLALTFLLILGDCAPRRSLPPPGPVERETEPPTVQEADSADLFFEVERNIEDKTGELEKLKSAIERYESTETAGEPRSDGLFFQTDTGIGLFREKIDSLKGVVRYYDITEKGVPEIDEDILGILKFPAPRQNITLRDGIIIGGQILAEDRNVIVMETAVGKLVIEKDFIAEYEEKFSTGARVEFEGDYDLIEYPDREEFRGVIRNVGKRKAYFVRVIFFLWDANTNPVGADSAFVHGSTTEFASGVISDASVAPGEKATYHVTVGKMSGKNVAYRTRDVKCKEYK